MQGNLTFRQKKRNIFLGSSPRERHNREDTLHYVAHPSMGSVLIAVLIYPPTHNALIFLEAECLQASKQSSSFLSVHGRQLAAGTPGSVDIPAFLPLADL